MKRKTFLLAMWLLQMHEQCDKDLSVGKLKCYDEYGKLTGLEYDHIPYTTRGQRFIGLGQYQTLWDTDDWKEAYGFLVDEGFLYENPEHKHHYAFLPIMKEEYDAMFEVSKLSIPYQERKNYKEYKASKEWKKKADYIKNRDGNKCVLCGSTENLNCHHKTYENLYHDNEEDLITLCKECHEKVHKGEVEI